MTTFLAQLDLGVSQLPPSVFIAIHLLIVLVGGYFAWRAFAANLNVYGWAFTMLAIAQLIYVGYHVQPPVLTFLFAHLLAEALMTVGFVLVFVAISAQVMASRRGTGTRART